MISKIILVLVAVLSLAGCDSFKTYDDKVNSLASKFPSEVDTAKNYLAMLRAHDFAGLEDRLDHQHKNAQLRGLLEKLAALFPAGEPTSVKLIGFQRNELVTIGQQSSSVTTGIVFEYAFPRQWLQAEVGLKKLNDGSTSTVLRIIPLRDSLENINRFSFAGKGFRNYLFLTLMIAIPILILIAFVICIRTPLPRRKWLWLLFISFGFTTCQFNWVDAAISFSPVSFQLFGVSVSGNPYTSAILAVSIPVGAILFLLLHGRRRGRVSPAGQST